MGNEYVILSDDGGLICKVCGKPLKFTEGFIATDDNNQAVIWHKEHGMTRDANGKIVPPGGDN